MLNCELQAKIYTPRTVMILMCPAQKTSLYKRQGGIRTLIGAPIPVPALLRVSPETNQKCLKKQKYSPMETGNAGTNVEIRPS